jgi:hypothetical protein
MGVAKTIFLSIAVLFMATVASGAQNIRKTGVRGGKVGILVGLSSDADSSQGKDGAALSR